jgi:hypothetical protein
MHHGSDGGDFLAAALVGGVPHPSGYPTYEVLLWTLTALFPGEPARWGNWLSAVCAALGVSVFAFLVHRTLSGTAWRGPVALSAALCLSASPALWSQAVITEVHGLNFLLVVSLMAFLWLWVRAPSRWWPAGAGLAFGLSLGNHLATLLLLPAAADWLCRNQRARPASRRECLMAAAAVLFGLTIYLYVPLAAATDPPVNWGDPRTPQRFWEVVSAQIYRPLIFGVEVSAIPGRITAWGDELVQQFAGGPWGALIALFGLWRLDRRDHAWWRFTVLVVLAYSVYAIGYDSADSYLYLIPAWTAVAFWLADGLSWMAQAATQTPVSEEMGAERSSSLAKPRTSQRPLLGILLGLVLVSLPLASALRHGAGIDARRDLRAQAFLDGALTEAEQGAVILVEEDARTFALWYGIYGLRRRPDLTPVNVRLYAFPWYRHTLASHHPQVLPPSGVDAADEKAFVADVVGRLPVYRAGPLSMTLPGLVEQPGGELVKMMPE